MPSHGTQQRMGREEQNSLGMRLDERLVEGDVLAPAADAGVDQGLDGGVGVAGPFGPWVTGSSWVGISVSPDGCSAISPSGSTGGGGGRKAAGVTRVGSGLSKPALKAWMKSWFCAPTVHRFTLPRTWALPS